MLEGELAYHSGKIEEGLSKLRHSVELSDSLPYDEPWGWMQPPRHALGALLLDQDRIEEAMALYRADLGLDETLPRALRHPHNVWALSGYHECLLHCPQVERGEMSAIEKQLWQAKETSDVKIGSSCYCRKSKVEDHVSKAGHVSPWRFNTDKTR